jgi:cyclopropane fatty-acyl-phospholipid synthase-like methyltransferase
MNKMRPYKSYIFRGGRDPIMEKTLTLMDNSGMSKTDIHKASNVSMSTMRNWVERTARPQFCTIAAVHKACGNKRIDI